jgi:hypothetical protein
MLSLPSTLLLQGEAVVVVHHSSILEAVAVVAVGIKRLLMLLLCQLLLVRLILSLSVGVELELQLHKAVMVQMHNLLLFWQLVVVEGEQLTPAPVVAETEEAVGLVVVLQEERPLLVVLVTLHLEVHHKEITEAKAHKTVQGIFLAAVVAVLVVLVEMEQIVRLLVVLAA